MSNNAQGVAPGFLLLPAQDYEWEVKDRIKIEIPLSGSIKQVIKDNNLLDDFKIAGEDEFSIFEDGVFQMWEVVRVLFASSKYPDLKQDECLNVTALELDGDTLIAHGEIIRSM